MRVYHGSDTLVAVIDLQKCKPNRDFGRGFYVTKLRSQAEDMSVRVTKRSKQTPIVTEYEISEIGEPLLEQLVLDFDIGEEKATDLFYSSETFGELADETTKLYKKTWIEIYEMLKNELKK